MGKVFVLDDEDSAIRNAKRMLESAAGRQLDIIVCHSRHEAEQILSESPPGCFDLLLVDLIVPHFNGQPVDREKDHEHGLAVIRTAWKHGHRVGLFLVSAYWDDVCQKISVELDREHIILADRLAKTVDLAGMKNWKHHFARYLSDITPLVELVRRETGLIVAHHTQLAAMRHLHLLLENALRAEKPHPLLVLLFRGRRGSGKSFWAEAAAVIKAHIARGLGAADAEPRFRRVSGSELSDRWSETDRIFLFGAAGFNGAYTDGPFIEASWYPGHTPPITRFGGGPSLHADRLRGGVCCIDEIASTYPAALEALLGVLNDGTVCVVGDRQHSIPVDCSVVLTTNLEIASAEAGERRPERTGELGTAFRDRIAGTLDIPSLSEMGIGTTVEILGELVRRSRRMRPRSDADQEPESALDPRVLSQDARAVLERLLEDDAITMRGLLRLAQHTEGPRVTAGAIQRAIPDVAATRRATRTKSSPPRPQEEGTVQSRQRHPSVRPPPPGWDLPFDRAQLGPAHEAWIAIRQDQGICIAHDLNNALKRVGLSPAALLALTVIAQAHILEGAVTEAEMERWFGAHKGHKLRNRLRGFSMKYPAIFKGTGKEIVKNGEHVRPVLIDDVKRWAGRLRVLAPEYI